MATIDFAIVTGLVEELDIVREVFPQSVEDSEDGNVWYRSRVEAENGENYEIVLASQSAMGPLSAHDLTLKVIQRWDPGYIVLVGIAGSFSEDVKLGDVIVAQQVFYYDLGKEKQGVIQYRPEGYPCSIVLVRQAEAFRSDSGAFKTWLAAARRSGRVLARKVARRRQNSAALDGAVIQKGRTHSQGIHFGSVASGSLVIADKAKRGELLALHGKLLGTEMEGAGVLHATFQQESPTPAIVIKGISDAADKNKAQLDTQGYWRRLAAENSARMVLGIIRRGRIRPTGADQFKLDPTLGATADARSEIPGPAAPRGVAFLAFPRLVVPRGPLIRLTAKVEALQKDGRKLDVLKLVVKYSDKTGILRKLEQHVGTIELNGLSAAAPVSVYLMLRGVPDSVKFAFSTPTSQRTAYWRANEQGRK